MQSRSTVCFEREERDLTARARERLSLFASSANKNSATEKCCVLAEQFLSLRKKPRKSRVDIGEKGRKKILGEEKRDGFVERKGFQGTFRKKHRFTSFITLVRVSAKIQWTDVTCGESSANSPNNVSRICVSRGRSIRSIRVLFLSCEISC